MPLRQSRIFKPANLVVPAHPRRVGSAAGAGPGKVVNWPALLCYAKAEKMAGWLRPSGAIG